MLERIQRRTTKVISILRDPSYDNRLDMINVMESRRTTGYEDTLEEEQLFCFG